MKRRAKDLEEVETPPSKKQKLDENTEYPSIPIDGDNLLSVLLYPLKKEEFIKNIWTKKHYNVSIDKPDRVKELLNGPFPFHLKTLLQDTASQKIHVWMKSKINKEKENNLLSFTVDDVDSALSCFHCGGNLYFRSSQELADIVSTLCHIPDGKYNTDPGLKSIIFILFRYLSQESNVFHLFISNLCDCDLCNLY